MEHNYAKNVKSNLTFLKNLNSIDDYIKTEELIIEDDLDIGLNEIIPSSSFNKTGDVIIEDFNLDFIKTEELIIEDELNFIKTENEIIEDCVNFIKIEKEIIEDSELVINITENEKNIENLTSFVKNVEKPTSFVKNSKPTSIIVKNVEKPTSFVKNSKPTSIIVKNVEKPTSFVKNSKPTYIIVKNVDKPTSIIVKNVEKPTFLQKNIEPTSLQKKGKPTSIAIEKNVEKPTSIIVKNVEKLTSFVKNVEKPTSFVENVEKPTSAIVENVEKPTSAIVENVEKPTSAIEKNVEKPTSAIEKNVEKSTSIVKNDEKPTSIAIEKNVEKSNSNFVNETIIKKIISNDFKDDIFINYIKINENLLEIFKSINPFKIHVYIINDYKKIIVTVFFINNNIIEKKNILLSKGQYKIISEKYKKIIKLKLNDDFNSLYKILKIVYTFEKNDSFFSKFPTIIPNDLITSQTKNSNPVNSMTVDYSISKKLKNQANIYVKILHGETEINRKNILRINTVYHFEINNIFLEHVDIILIRREYPIYSIDYYNTINENRCPFNINLPKDLFQYKSIDYPNKSISHNGVRVRVLPSNGKYLIPITFPILSTHLELEEKNKMRPYKAKNQRLVFINPETNHILSEINISVVCVPRIKNISQDDSDIPVKRKRCQ